MITQRRSRLRHLRWIVPLVVVILVVAAVGQYLRPVPDVRLVGAVAKTTRLPGTLPKLPWPATGEAAVAVNGVGMLGSSGGTGEEPIGSLGKVMTALLVLRSHPLTPGESGPVLTVTAADVATYQQDLATGQSVVQVSAGEQLSELQLLQALLVPSGNNIATLLATWDAGSVSAFVAQMNQEAGRLGLQHTHYADPAGLSSSTESDAIDQTRLAEVAMANPTFASIVGLAQVTLPVAGVAYNVNADVTHNGIVGVKTGSTPQAGGCFIFAADRSVGNHTVTIIGTVLGQQGTSIIDAALAQGVALANAVGPLLGEYTVVPSGKAVADISPAWTGEIPVTSSESVSLIGWPGLAVSMRVVADRLGTKVVSGQKVGDLDVVAGSDRTQVVLHAPTSIGSPSLRWRLTRL